MTTRAIDGAKLAFWLKRRGRAQRWLAGKLKVGETDFSHMVHGRRAMDARIAGQVAALLGVEPREILPD